MAFHIVQVSENPHPDIIRLWEEHMQEPWADYLNATHFVQCEVDGDFPNNIHITGGFAVYYDESDGVRGHFISGWSKRKNFKSVGAVIQHLANKLGEVYIKTEKRHVKIFAGKLGKLVKNAGPFSYYKVKGETNGKSKRS